MIGKSNIYMLCLIRKIAFLAGFLILITDYYGAAVETGNPSNFVYPQVGTQKALHDANARLKIWLQTHKEGQEFLKSGYIFPNTIKEFKDGGNKPLEAYKNFYAAEQAKSAGADNVASGKIGDFLKAELGVNVEDQNEFLDQAAQKVKALKLEAAQAEEAQKRVLEEEAQKRRALEALEVQGRQEVALRQQAEAQQHEKDALEFHNLELQAQLKPDDLAAIEKRKQELLEKMQEANALKNAMDSLRFLTYYIHQQAKFAQPVKQLEALNAKAAILFNLTKIKDILEKNELILPINVFDNIPFFREYHEDFNKPAFKILQAWLVLQQCPKLKNGDLNKIKKWADAKKQKAKNIEKQTEEIMGLLKTVVNDVLWEAFKGSNQLNYAQIYFWSQMYDRYPLEKAFISIRDIFKQYEHFTSRKSLETYAKRLGNNQLLHFAFMADSIETELDEETAAQNFAMLFDLRKSYKSVVDALNTYNNAAPDFFAVAAQDIGIDIQKLAKRDFAALQQQPPLNLIGQPNFQFIGSMSLLESWFFCLNQEDPRIVAFNAANGNKCATIYANSEALLNQIVSFMEILQRYNKDCYQHALAGGDRADIRLLTYERPEPLEVKAVEPPTLKQQLQDTIAQSDQEKGISNLDKEIAKIRTIVERERNADGSEKHFEEVIVWLNQVKVANGNSVPRDAAAFAFYKEALATPALIALIEKAAISFSTKIPGFERIDSELFKKIIQKYSEKLNEYNRPTSDGLKVLDITKFTQYLFGDGLKAMKEMASDLQQRVDPRGIFNLLKDMQSALGKPDLKTWIEKSEINKNLKKIKNVNLPQGTRFVLKLKDIEKVYTDHEILRFIETLPKLLAEYSKVAPAVQAQAGGNAEIQRLEATIALYQDAISRKNAGEVVKDPDNPAKNLSNIRKGALELSITQMQDKLKQLRAVAPHVAVAQGPSRAEQIAALEAEIIVLEQEEIDNLPIREKMPKVQNLQLKRGQLKQLREAPPLAVANMGPPVMGLGDAPNGVGIKVPPVGPPPVGQLPIIPVIGGAGPLQAEVREIPYAEKLQKLKDAVERLKIEQSKAQDAFNAQPEKLDLVQVLKRVSDELNSKKRELNELENPPVIVGQSLPIENFKMALDDLMVILTQAMDNGDYLRFLEEEKRKLDAAIPAIRKNHLGFLNVAANAQFAGYQELMTHVNEGIAKFFKAIDLRKYINPNLSNAYIVKFMNEFLASFEIILWQKIEEFGLSVTRKLEDAARVEIEAKKAGFEASFNDATLEQLTTDKLIAKETLTSVTGKVLSLVNVKLSDPGYQAVFDGAEVNNPVIFDAIIKCYVTKLGEEEKARVHQKQAFKIGQNPLIGAIKKLRKTQDAVYQKNKDHLGKLIDQSHAQIKELDDILRLASQYIGELKVGKANKETKVKLENVFLQGAFYEIREVCFKTGGANPLNSFLYDFFTNVTNDYIRSNGDVGKYIGSLHTDYEAARKNMDQYPDITVMGILENTSNVLPLIFKEVYAYLRDLKNNSEFEFAGYVLERFVREFHPAVAQKVEEMFNSEAHQPQEDLPDDDHNADPVVQLQFKTDLLAKELDEIAGSYRARYRDLNPIDPLLLIQQQQIVIEFIEASEIIDKRTQQEVEKRYKEQLKALMQKPIKDAGFEAVDSQTLLDEALANFGKKLLKELAAKKLHDQKEAALLEFYQKNPQVKIANILKNIQSDKQSKAELVTELAKKFKGIWLARKLDELCKKGENIVDFSSILKELIKMPIEDFLGSFFEIQVAAELPTFIQYIDSDIPQNDAGSPPALIWKIVEQKIKEGMNPQDIVVVFDWDGTIIGKKGDAHNLQTGIRWERPMFEALDKLQKAGVNLVIDTASKRSGIYSILIKSQEVGLLKFFGVKDAPKNESDIKNVEKMMDGEDMYQWENIISGSSGYNKAGYLEKYMKLEDIQPKLIIFTDDAAHNVLEMHTAFTAKNKTQFVGIHVPQVDLDLSPHNEILQMLKSDVVDAVLVERLDADAGEPEQATKALEIKRALHPLPQWLK